MEDYLNEHPKKISREELKKILRDRKEKIDIQQRQMWNDAQVARIADLREMEARIMAAVEALMSRL